MLKTNSISPIQHKILLVIAFFICCIFFSNIADKFIEKYNIEVKYEQIRKRDSPNSKGGKLDLSGGPLSLHFEILNLQFLIVPFLFILFIKRHIAFLFVSTSLNSFLLYAYFCWLIQTLTNPHYPNIITDSPSFSEFFLFGSTFLELILMILITSLFIFQTFILIRFVIEQFQVKIFNR